MQNSTSVRQRASLEVPWVDFQHQIQKLQSQGGRSPTGSLLSRLALIHQVAKACVVEERARLGTSATDIEIDEITDPPMYDLDVEDGIVRIQYSYVENGQALS